jgi:hypothetical protein
MSHGKVRKVTCQRYDFTISCDRTTSPSETCTHGCADASVAICKTSPTGTQEKL